MTYRSRTKATLAVVLVGVLSLSAVATPVAAQENVTAEYEITVTENGEVETVDLVVTADEETYSEWQAGAALQGYDSFAEFLGSSLAEDEPALNEYTAEEEELEDGYEAQVQFTDVDVSESENMSVSVDDGTVRWESTEVGDVEEDGEFDEVTYTVVMPGEVTDSNADEVSDGEAVWQLHEGSPDEIYAEASVDDGLPGLGVGAALAGLVGAVLLLTRRTD